MTQPYIDIYTLTNNRDKKTIESFLYNYTDREAIEDQQDGELMVLPNGKNRKNINSDEYVWTKAISVSNSIDIGLANPENCFTMYLNSNKPDIDYAILTFTQDGKLILGLSIFEYQDDESTIDNYKLAETLCKKIENDYFGVHSYFGLEASPADNLEEFLAQMKIWTPNKNYSQH
jgi:hypothetical protein